MSHKNTISIVLAVVSMVALAAVAAGATLTVNRDGSGDYMLIQLALDAAADGDTVLIGPGEFTEETFFRPPGWGYDIRALGRVVSDNLTIIGAGVGVTVLGPVEYVADHQQFNPKGLYYDQWGHLTVENLTVRNCRTAIKGGGTIFVQGCEFLGNYQGLGLETIGSGGWVKSTNMEAVIGGASLSVTGPSSEFVVEDCDLSRGEVVVRSLDGFRMTRCKVSLHGVALAIYGPSNVFLDQCEFEDISVVGISFDGGSGSICNIQNSIIHGDVVAVQTRGGNNQLIIDSSTLVGGSQATIRAQAGSGPIVIHNSDFIKGTGPVIWCESTTPVTHDLTNNYWGTSDVAQIEEWIIDENDDPGIAATVLFDPYSNVPLPVDSNTKSFGGMKAMFR